MKTLTFLIALSVFFAFSGCEEDPEGRTFDATVHSLESECGPPLISFRREDIPAVERIINGKSLGYFIAYGLSRDAVDEGQTISVTIRKMRDDENTLCTTMGPSYSWVAIEKFSVE